MVDHFFLDEISSVLCLISIKTIRNQLVECRRDIWFEKNSIKFHFFRLKFRKRSCRCGYLIRFHLEQLYSQFTVCLCVYCLLFNRMNEHFSSAFHRIVPSQSNWWIIVSFNQFNYKNWKWFLCQSIEWMRRTNDRRSHFHYLLSVFCVLRVSSKTKTLFLLLWFICCILFCCEHKIAPWHRTLALFWNPINWIIWWQIIMIFLFAVQQQIKFVFLNFRGRCYNSLKLYCPAVKINDIHFFHLNERNHSIERSIFSFILFRITLKGVSFPWLIKNVAS